MWKSFFQVAELQLRTHKKVLRAHLCELPRYLILGVMVLLQLPVTRGGRSANEFR
jgi:hypothetical protein